MKLRISLPAVSCALALASASCGGDAEFHVATAPDLPHAPITASVLGVYKDGRLAPEAWQAVGPTLCKPFSGGCAVGFDDALAASKPDLASAIDDVSRAEGVGDELLERLAPAAKGDAIVVFTIAGSVKKWAENGGNSPTAAPPPPGPNMGRMGAQPRALSMPSVAGKRSGYEVSATVYLVKAHKAVAVVAMDYDGPSEDDALRKFADKMRTELPPVTCSGWSWDKGIDADRVRASE